MFAFSLYSAGRRASPRWQWERSKGYLCVDRTPLMAQRQAPRLSRVQDLDAMEQNEAPEVTFHHCFFRD